MILVLPQVSNRRGEAATLNNMAAVYRATGQPQQALTLYQQALPIMREVGNRAGEATTLSNMAVLLYQQLNRAEDAITHLEQAIAVLEKTGLPQDAAGQTIEDLRQWLQIMRTGDSPEAQAGGSAIIPAEQLQQIISTTIAVMTSMPDSRAAWREAITEALQDAQQRGAAWQIEVDFFTAVLAILAGQSPSLAPDHPYTQALAAIHNGIAPAEPQQENSPSQESLPFDTELITSSIAALLGGSQEKLTHAQHLATQLAQTTDEQLKALINTIQLALFGSDLTQLGQTLNGVYRQAWETIVLMVETEGVDPHLFEHIISNTRAVLGPIADKRNAWRTQLMQIKSQAMEGSAQKFIALLNAIISLLDADGNPTGLGTELTGIHAQTWQAIVER